MRHLPRRVTPVFAMAVLLAGDAPPPRPPAAEKVLGLFERLQSAGEKKAANTPSPHVAFELSEREMNDYSVYALKVTPRPGVRSVAVKVFSNNYISTLALVDFDALERWKPGTIPVFLKPLLMGQKSIWLDLRFRADHGQTTFSVEKAYFENIRLPAIFVEKMIQIVAARQPEHYDTTKPVPLPFGLAKLWTKDHAVLGEN